MGPPLDRPRLISPFLTIGGVNLEFHAGWSRTQPSPIPSKVHLFGTTRRPETDYSRTHARQRVAGRRNEIADDAGGDFRYAVIGAIVA